MKSFGFEKHKRLTKAIDFEKVFTKGVKTVGHSVVIFKLPNELSHPRMGVVVSRKVSKSAVVRNRVKRLTREVFRLHQSRLESCDIIVLARRTLTDATVNFIDFEKKMIRVLPWAPEPDA